jgi:hypothetical protein
MLELILLYYVWKLCQDKAKRSPSKALNLLPPKNRIEK